MRQPKTSVEARVQEILQDKVEGIKVVNAQRRLGLSDALVPLGAGALGGGALVGALLSSQGALPGGGAPEDSANLEMIARMNQDLDRELASGGPLSQHGEALAAMRASGELPPLGGHGQG